MRVVRLNNGSMSYSMIPKGYAWEGKVDVETEKGRGIVMKEKRPTARRCLGGRYD